MSRRAQVQRRPRPGPGLGDAGRTVARLGFRSGAVGKSNSMGLIEILLVVLLVVVLVGAFSGYGGGAYRAPGIGLGGILLIILLVLLLT